jgi:hypothetical protein
MAGNRGAPASPSTASAASAATSCARQEVRRAARFRRRQRPDRQQDAGAPAALRLRARPLPGDRRGQPATASRRWRRDPRLSEKDPAQLPWKDLGVDIVFEGTGRFTSARRRQSTSTPARARSSSRRPPRTRTSPSSWASTTTSTTPAAHHVISNASCTTNCLAPVVKVLLDSFGFRRGLMTTVHAYTNDQNILDLPHKDLRRARAAAMSIIPTTTGAAKATSLVLPEVKGRIDGMAMRVPTPDVSIVDLTAELEKTVTVDQVNDAFRSAAAAAQGHPRRFRRAARQHRLHRQPGTAPSSTCSPRSSSRSAGEGHGVVRQRVGLLRPLRRPGRSTSRSHFKTAPKTLRRNMLTGAAARPRPCRVIDADRRLVLPLELAGVRRAADRCAIWHASRAFGSRSVHAGAGGAMMATQGEQLYGTYRCPVCGHRDAAELEPDEKPRACLRAATATRRSR